MERGAAAPGSGGPVSTAEQAYGRRFSVTYRGRASWAQNVYMNATQSIYASAVPASLRCWALAASPSSPPRLNARATATRTSSTGTTAILLPDRLCRAWCSAGAHGRGHSTLFCQPKDLEREIWDGYRLGPAAAPEALGWMLRSPLRCWMPNCPPAGKPQLRLVPFATHGPGGAVEGWLNAVRARVRYGSTVPSATKRCAPCSTRCASSGRA